MVVFSGVTVPVTVELVVAVVPVFTSVVLVTVFVTLKVSVVLVSVVGVKTLFTVFKSLLKNVVGSTTAVVSVEAAGAGAVRASWAKTFKLKEKTSNKTNE